jgi:outer membrane protein W
VKASVIRPLAKAVTLAVAVGGAAVAQAHQAGDLIVRLGAASVQPDDDSSALNLVGTGGLPASGASVESNTRIGLTGTYMVTDNWGVAFQAGVDYRLGNNWLLNAGVWKIDIDTEAEFKFSNGAVVTTDVEIDPYVYMLSVGYSF